MKSKPANEAEVHEIVKKLKRAPKKGKYPKLKEKMMVKTFKVKDIDYYPEELEYWVCNNIPDEMPFTMEVKIKWNLYDYGRK
jgi:hypothetical protein